MNFVTRHSLDFIMNSPMYIFVILSFPNVMKKGVKSSKTTQFFFFFLFGTNKKEETGETLSNAQPHEQSGSKRNLKWPYRIQERFWFARNKRIKLAGWALKGWWDLPWPACSILLLLPQDKLPCLEVRGKQTPYLTIIWFALFNLKWLHLFPTYHSSRL